MKLIALAVGALAAFAATSASAQSVNLTGAYRCVQACRGGLVGNPAYITQNGPELNLLNEAGEPSTPAARKSTTGAVAATCSSARRAIRAVRFSAARQDQR